MGANQSKFSVNTYVRLLPPAGESLSNSFVGVTHKIVDTMILTEEELKNPPPKVCIEEKEQCYHTDKNTFYGLVTHTEFEPSIYVKRSRLLQPSSLFSREGFVVDDPDKVRAWRLQKNVPHIVIIDNVSDNDDDDDDNTDWDGKTSPPLSPPPHIIIPINEKDIAIQLENSHNNVTFRRLKPAYKQKVVTAGKSPRRAHRDSKKSKTRWTFFSKSGKKNKLRYK